MSGTSEFKESTDTENLVHTLSPIQRLFITITSEEWRGYFGTAYISMH